MGLFNYEKEINERVDEFKGKYQEYLDECNKIKKETIRHINEYNKHIGVINAEIHNGRNDLKSLYKFLSVYGDCGAKITPFDFAGESPIFFDESDYIADDINAEKKKNDFATNAAGVANTLLVSSIPVIGLPLITGQTIGNKMTSKKDYLEYVRKCDESEMELDRDIVGRKMQCELYESLARIASLYRATISSVIDAIRDTILPELEGIKCFLYADAIKDNIICGYPIDEVKLKKITSFSNPSSPYYPHYIFMKNTLDYYEMLKAAFVNSTLDQFVDAGFVFDDELNEISDKLISIREDTDNLKEKVVF